MKRREETINPENISINRSPNENHHPSLIFSPNNSNLQAENNNLSNIFEELRLQWMNKSDGSNNSNSDSSFASSTDSDPFQMGLKLREDDNWNDNNYTPLYRNEYGGVLIYDIDAIIPDQPVPPFDCEEKDSILR